MQRLRSADFVDLLGDLNELVRSNFNEKVLGGMEMFKGLSKPQQTVLVDSLMEEKYEKGEHIIEQDEEGDAFFIIVSGSVKVTRRDPQTDALIMIKDKLNPGAYFGERRGRGTHTRARPDATCLPHALRTPPPPVRATVHCHARAYTTGHPRPLGCTRFSRWRVRVCYVCVRYPCR